MSVPTCVVVDDHDLVREGMRYRLEQNGAATVVGSAESAAIARYIIAKLDPDVALIDLRLPDQDGIELTRWLRAEGFATKVLLITGNAGPPLVEEALSAGADGFVSKLSPAEILIAAVAAVHAGKRFIDPTIACDLMEYRAMRLSPREQQVLAMIVNGSQNSAIALALKVSPETAKTHVASIFRKLEVHSRSEVVAKSLREGLVL